MKLLVCIVFAICLQSAYSAMSEAQMKSTAKLLRNNCQPKTKVTNDQIDAMHKGVWDGNRNAMCYMQCVLKMLKVLDADGNFSMDSVRVQLPNIPDSMRAKTESTVNNCEPKIVQAEDPCDTAYQIAKCFYEDNPSNYFLP